MAEIVRYLSLQTDPKPAIIRRMGVGEARKVVVVAYPGLQPLDVVGPAEVFTAADAISGGRAYTVEVVASQPSPISAPSGGYAIAPQKTTARLRGPIDTLLVAGAVGAVPSNDARLVAWIRGAARRSRRVASVCTGAFLLAEAGLLDGRRATTHWLACDELARRYPAIEVDPDPIFVRDGDLWTSAGVTAGIDMALALVEEDLGHAVALQVARGLILFLQRPGGQSQFSSHLSAQRAQREPLRELQDWMADNLDADLRVESLAARANMSPRNFARFFRRETGLTPAAYVEALRVERARQWLEQGAEPVEQVARRCGFGTPETMRRAFDRRVGMAPASYRARFRRAANGDRAAPAAKEN
jgi:transcriptional regulator GlxA family with amidase domain